MSVPNPHRVARRFQIRMAAAAVRAAPLRRVARRDRAASRVRAELSQEVLEAFGEASLAGGNVRVASLTKKLKKLWDIFQSAPRKWEDFKGLLRVKADSLMGVLRELPGKIKGMIRDGQKWLSQIGKTLSSKIPELGLYLELGKKIPTAGDWLKQAIQKMPAPIQKVISAVATKANSLAAWIDELTQKYRVIKPAAKIVSAGLFASIWFNVTELSWDIPEILRGFLGGYSFVQLLQSLPESGLGLLLGLMFPGIPGGLIWNALLPITLVLKISWLIRNGYVTRQGKSFQVNWEKMGVPKPQ
jgi:hypothetical protein